MKKRRKALSAAAAVLLMGSMLGACGSTSSDMTTLEVDDLSIIQHIVEPADYAEDKADLESFITESVDQYNQEAGGEYITLDSCSLDSESVRVQMTYASYVEYAAFNQMPCFLGTLTDAAAQGYDLNINLKDKNGEEVNGQILLSSDPTFRVLIIQEPVQIKTDTRIQYVSDGVEITGSKTAVISGSGTEPASVYEAETTETLNYIVIK